ncbi:hypothetical protein AX16_010710 [Volvariella volvacea WC 439]|nr:hypothetical protein AX16_010710 [Volvariella volvacea WC 439]
MARPAPARPPDALIRGPTSQDLQIRELTTRIASLEQALASHVRNPSNEACSRVQSPSHSSDAQGQSRNVADGDRGLKILGPTTHSANLVHDPANPEAKPQVHPHGGVHSASQHDLHSHYHQSIHSLHSPPAPHIHPSFFDEKAPNLLISPNSSLAFGNANSAASRGVGLNTGHTTTDDTAALTSLHSHPLHPSTIVTSSNATSDLMRTSFSPEPLPGSLGHEQYEGIHKVSSDAVTSDDAVRTVPIHPNKLLNHEVYDRTSALAQLSLAHYGEYIGRGSVICALHSLCDGQTPRFLHAKSTIITSHHEAHPPFSPVLSSLTPSLDQLLRSIPSPAVTSAIIQAYFDDINWRFGIPEQWFRQACQQMWMTLQYATANARDLRINVHWLILFFAVLASVPQEILSQFAHPHEGSAGETKGDGFFSCAIAARRIAEDEHLKWPSSSLTSSAAEGEALGCLAMPLLSSYLAERGRVSEAWKMLGTAIRNAESIGMHRDPGWRQWQIMSEDERLLRRRAWWGLVILDKLYSFVLGRPKMIRKEISDVALPSLGDPDVSEDHFNLFQAVFIQLSGIVGETLDKCFNVEYPNCPVFFEMDQKFSQWESCLPDQLQYGYQGDVGFTSNSGPSAGSVPGGPAVPDSTTKCNSDQLSLTWARQRYTLHTWYLLIRMKLHIASLIGRGRPAQSPAHLVESGKLCILFAMRLITVQCDAWENAKKCCSASRNGHGVDITTGSGNGDIDHALPGSHWYFEGCYSLFEGAVALMTTLARFPWKEKVIEAEHLIDRSLGVLTEVVREERGKRGEIAKMGLGAVAELAKERWWRAPSEMQHQHPRHSNHNQQRYPPLHMESSTQMHSSAQPDNHHPAAQQHQGYYQASSYDQLHPASQQPRHDQPHTPPHQTLSQAAVLESESVFVHTTPRHSPSQTHLSLTIPRPPLASTPLPPSHAPAPVSSPPTPIAIGGLPASVQQHIYQWYHHTTGYNQGPSASAPSSSSLNPHHAGVQDDRLNDGANGVATTISVSTSITHGGGGAGLSPIRRLSMHTPSASSVSTAARFTSSTVVDTLYERNHGRNGLNVDEEMAVVSPGGHTPGANS